MLACSNGNESAQRESNATKADTTTEALPSGLEAGITDTLKGFIVDNFPVTDTMLAHSLNTNSSRKMQSGRTISFDKVWFRNDSLHQTLVLELYTDYHRLVTYHFLSGNIPTDLVNSMELHTVDGDLASHKQKQHDIHGLITRATPIRSSYFISNNGFRLGDTMTKALDIYGKPDRQTSTNGVERLEWSYLGDLMIDASELEGTKYALNSYGHQVTMYFKEDKLIAHVLFNDVP